MPNTVKKNRNPSHQKKVISEFVSAGIECVASTGVDRTTVSQVIQAAGASRPTFYTYFGNIGGLLAEIWIEKGEAFLSNLANPSFRYEVADPKTQAETSALLEIFTVSHRFPELKELVPISTKKWWGATTESRRFGGVLDAWLIANRLGMWLTIPVEPLVIQANILAVAADSLTQRLDSIVEEPAPRVFPPIGNPELRGNTIRGELLEAALEVIAVSGVAAASMSRIARKAQLTTGTIYPRFSSANDLILELFSNAVEDVVRQNFSHMSERGFTSEQFGLIVAAGLMPLRESWRNFRTEMFVEAKYNTSIADKLRASLTKTNIQVAKGLGELSITSREREAVAFLTHTIGIGMAILLNNRIPVDKLDHALITKLLAEALTYSSN